MLLPKEPKPPLKESALVAKIIKKLRIHRGGFWVKVHGGLWQTVGLPDIIGCYRGRFVGLEVKVPGKEDTLTARQKYILSVIKDAGGIAEMVVSVDQALEVVPVE